ncbi:hypothetical protein [Streptomyces sp. NBC_01618]|uniref:hypothetical protein n=1 Tax=Streptomyces sp. NBC_01618 TaxID=2975900 RepID=UPI00386519BF|nr:hypothetical protein OH735_22130 [Streptomyces sp. NBC_01618]
MAGRNGRPRVPAEEPATRDSPADSAADATTGAAAPAGPLAEDLAPADHRADGAASPVSDSADGPDTLSGLLAVLGGHLESHTLDEVMVLLREEMERRELRAYSSGWRDAAAHYEPALQEARAADGRMLRLVRGASGQAAVIPFRQQGRNATDRRTGDRGREGDATDERPARTGPAAGAERGDRSPAPALVPKSRSSRVPTIPRLRPPPRRPAGGTAPVAPDGESL